MKLPELMGAIEKMEDLVRRYCARLTSYGVLREEIKHTVSVEVTQHET